MDKGREGQLSAWVDAGLITAAQAEAIKEFETARDEPEQTPPPPPETRQPEKRRTRRRQTPPNQAPMEPERQWWARNSLVHSVVNPPFARRPPFFVNARWVGFAAAALAALGLFVGLITLSTDLLLAPGRVPRELPFVVLQLAAATLGLTGGYLMVSRRRRGKRLVVASLALDVLGNAIPDPRHLVHLDSLLQVLLWLVLYYLVVVSRYERVTTSLA
jgi:hypothetical protein